jgi:hypothetical protein
MSQYPRRVLIIIPAEYQAVANQAALGFDETGGDRTFTVGLSADGQEPATHFWASIQMREETFQGVSQLLPAQFPQAVMIEYNLDTERGRPGELLAEMGLMTISNEQN